MHALHVIVCCASALFLFFKQKTAYEMRISDWSSDVCSSDRLSPWLVMLTSRRDLGVWTRRAGLFATPEELRPSQLLLEGGTEWDNVVQIAPAQIGRKERAAPGSWNGGGELIPLH